MKMVMWSLVGIIAAFVGFYFWASFPWSIQETIKRPEILTVNPEFLPESAEEKPSVVKVLTFNIGYLYGKGSEGPGYVHREKDYYENALNKISSEIKEWAADIVFLQEIDFNSSRSNHIDQAKFIANKAGYPYIAEAVSWNANYIPFPYWPLSNNFGSMKSGGAILSRFPLSDHEVTLLAKPAAQPWWYNLFYLHRYFQRVTVTIGDKKFKLINLHLEAFDKVDRESQVVKLAEKIKAENIDIVAGDFNALPASATKKTKFYSNDDYVNDGSYAAMTKSNLQEVIPDEIYAKDEPRYFTFPAWAPDRRLDYIWYKPDLKMMKAEVLPSASSDHLPLRASFQIGGPGFNPYSQ
jgi:endonuclease/exonuclease/phosphatase family metal-dependent hydrolase